MRVSVGHGGEEGGTDPDEVPERNVLLVLHVPLARGLARVRLQSRVDSLLVHLEDVLLSFAEGREGRFAEGEARNVRFRDLGRSSAAVR